ncbi:Rieske (2Fe-2S) protein [Conexibacter sp. SYSU D00693]|uniref:Rieske 2Fe-2S domain-containing protein n=1 Tax=Conexibacter sp. SYSU D00693 TaxID=2812560 RepID=UPI00196AB443|nr:Rieske (2Fe-2S) protein [Conexibacter sp. SYSU D00693]
MHVRSPAAHAAAERLGEVEALSADPVASAVRNVLGTGAVKDALSGVPSGHPIHPALTDLAIGSWTSATILDLVGGEGSQQAADKLVAVGLLSTVPVIATGMSDWADTIGPERRIGTAHALTNAAATACYAASLAARRSGRRGTGVLLGLAGASIAGAGAWLGGHLAFSRGVGVDETTFERPPEDWTAVARAEELVEGRPKAVRAGGVEAVLVRRGGRVHALADRCNHRGGSLADGELQGDCLVCPLHGSVFALEDGSVERGPATAPQPVYEVRERDGTVELRAAG